MKKFILVLLAVALCLPPLSCAAKAQPTLLVNKIENLSDDFIMGADVSSLLALENSGVKFYDFNGNEQDMLKTMQQCGVNYIRVRVWNDPYDSSGNGYGGGNCDVETAAALGARAAKYGMKLLVNFHYSDFWADPSKQQCPKAWENMEFEEKQHAIAEFTAQSLQTISDAGADIGMVQIGNETNNGLAGEIYWLKATGLMAAAADSVRAFDPEILIAAHFTNPENGQYKNFAFQLVHHGVDFDIFASSYYPFWHGSLENLQNELSVVADAYDKRVMIAETAYAYTIEDTDTHPNTIGEAITYEKPYPFTLQGQTTSVASVINAMAELGDRAIGVFYWEPAWIAAVPVSWETQGSGWAASYASEYDSDDAGLYYGGSACDNQALFDAEGHPLESLRVFSYVRSGTKVERKIDAVEDAHISVRLGTDVVLPDTIRAIYNDGSESEANVEWESSDLESMKNGSVQLYTVNGMAGDSPVRCYVSMEEANFVENSGFENDNYSMWVIDNFAGTDQIYFQNKVSDAHSGSMSLHFWDASQVGFTVEQKIKNLVPGTYRFTLSLQGGDAVSASMRIYAISDGETYMQETGVDGWVNWQQPVIEAIVTQSGEITIGISIECAGGWGTIDDVMLNPVK